MLNPIVSSPVPPQPIARLRIYAFKSIICAWVFRTSRSAALAAALAEEQQAPGLKAAHVLVACGAAGALTSFFRAVLEPGDEVLCPAPYFVEYGFYCGHFGGVLKPVPALKPGFDLDVAAMLAAIGPSTRVIIINSPNNPTGCVYSQATLARLAAGLEQVNRNRERPVFLLSDEPYRFLTYDGVVVPPILPLSPFAVVVGSFSKRLSIAGERIGYLAINPGMPDGGLLMQAVAMTTRTLGFVNAPVIGQKLALMLLNEGVDLGIYAHRRALMAQVLDAAGISYTMPQGAFYFYPAAPGGDDLAFVQHLLAENILAVPVAASMPRLRPELQRRDRDHRALSRGLRARRQVDVT